VSDSKIIVATIGVGLSAIILFEVLLRVVEARLFPRQPLKSREE